MKLTKQQVEHIAAKLAAVLDGVGIGMGIISAEACTLSGLRIHMNHSTHSELFQDAEPGYVYETGEVEMVSTVQTIHGPVKVFSLADAPKKQEATQ